MKELRLGFSTGCFYKTTSTRHALDILKANEQNTVELGFVKSLDWEFDLITPLDLYGFGYVSLHAPTFRYGDNPQSWLIFEKIKELHSKRPLDLVVFHPDTVEDFSVFLGLDFPVAFENMDNRKNCYKTPRDFINMAARLHHTFPLVLDVNHVFSNDPTMELAGEFYRHFAKNMAQIHLSGYSGYHEPLFETRQTQIICSIQNTKIPIIIEGIIEPTKINRELEYIKKVIKGQF